MNNNTNTNNTKTQEEIIADLRKQLEEAKKGANGCNTSTLMKVGKATLGVTLIAGAAAAGFYFGTKEAVDTTTVVVSE